MLNAQLPESSTRKHDGHRGWVLTTRIEYILKVAGFYPVRADCRAANRDFGPYHTSFTSFF